MTVLLLVPALLSLLVLAAHFFRGGHLIAVGLCIALVAGFFIRRSWSARVLQVCLLAGSVEWIRTVADLAAARRAMSMPWLRMSLILGGVALFTALAALLLEAPQTRRWFGILPRKA